MTQDSVVSGMIAIFQAVRILSWPPTVLDVVQPDALDDRHVVHSKQVAYRLDSDTLACIFVGSGGIRAATVDDGLEGAGGELVVELDVILNLGLAEMLSALGIDEANQALPGCHFWLLPGWW